MSLVQGKDKLSVGKKIAIGTAIGVAVVAVAYICVAYGVYSNKFIPNKVIDGINCGGLTVEEAKVAFESVITDYSLSVTDGVTTDLISSADIDLKGNFDTELEEVLEGQNRLMWGIGLFNKEETEIASKIAVTYNEEGLNNKISEMQLINGANVKDSVNAALKLDSKNRYEVVPEAYGNRLDRESFTERVKQAISTLEKEIDLNKEDLYIKPEVYQDNEQLLLAKDTANKYLESVITYTFGSNKEVVDDSLTKDWIVIDKDFNVFFDRTPVLEFVRSISRKYDTFGDTRTIPTSYGFNVAVVGGNYGYRMNREGEINELVADLKTGEKKDRVPEYYQEGVSYEGLDIGNTYVEVDLTGQHLFLYDKGNLVLQTEIVSGHPKKGVTPNGTYRITYCERNATLRGDNYETPVAYWMPFNGDIGLHDATWQPKFGGDWYVRHGSHGCVNLPLSMAAQIYSYAYKGMPVICYRYGTENYNQVEAYRKGHGLPSIFDVQPAPAPETITEATTVAATETVTETTTASAA